MLISYVFCSKQYYFHAFEDRISIHDFDRLQMSSQSSSDTRYNPFRYPPDYALARTHQQATMPGIANKRHAVHCPCCNEKVKEPFKSWWSRSIQKDFSKFGGAVVVYFWLLKLYSLASVLIIIVYGGYLTYLSDYYCDQLVKTNVDQDVCSKLWGVWIITNEDLRTQISESQDQGTEVRYFTLRSMTFFILLVVNYLSLFIVKWYKLRYPTKKTIANFSLIFKNLKNDQIDLLLDQIKGKVGQFDYRQAFIIKKIEPFYTQYQRKLQTYYSCKLEENVKKYSKLLKELHSLDKFCSQMQESFYNDGNRAIVVFHDIATRQKVYDQYKITKWRQLRMFFSNAYETKHGTYCEHCPQPCQIIWNNIGVIERQGFKVKVLSVIYLVLIMAFLMLILYWLLDWLYKGKMDEPYRTIIQNVILNFLVVVALSFRSWMNKLSEMRFPNTYTRRTMFIVITTVLFHFIFYLFLPTSYLRFEEDMRGSILNLISNQALAFIIVQVILSGFDLMYCCWNRRRATTQNQDKPIGCQKILHEKMQYPRFPIQFKLIILFKIWSFITFFAFHVPLVLLFILIALVFLYVKDKMNLYYHYRMEAIDNEVQFKFLKIYANVFTIYLYETFVFTQSDPIEYTVGAVVTIFFIVIQLMYFGKLDYKQETDQEEQSVHLSQIEDKSFSRDYQTFLNNARNDLVDVEIRQYLSKQGFGTMKTEQSLTSQLMSTD